MFKRGTKCRILTWDELLAIGLRCTSEGIFLPDKESFLSSMRYMCGKEFTILSSYKIGIRTCYRSVENIEIDADGCRWEISECMLKKIPAKLTTFLQEAMEEKI